MRRTRRRKPEISHKSSAAVWTGPAEPPLDTLRSSPVRRVRALPPRAKRKRRARAARSIGFSSLPAPALHPPMPAPQHGVLACLADRTVPRRLSIQGARWTHSKSTPPLRTRRPGWRFRGETYGIADCQGRPGPLGGIVSHFGHVEAVYDPEAADRLLHHGVVHGVVGVGVLEQPELLLSPSLRSRFDTSKWKSV